MRITRVQASNWRNFKSLDFELGNRLFIVGPNAAGKSNLLDLFQFLSDLVRSGGGLAAAIAERGGLGSVRSLFARNYQRGRLVLDVELEDGTHIWKYHLSIKGEGSGKNRTLVDSEIVTKDGQVILNRPDSADKADPERLTQTHLEQIAANHEFRAVADYFDKIHYFHLVPQIIRDPLRAGLLAGDPFGGDFIAQMNKVQPTTRRAWLQRLEQALQAAVPEFESLAIEVDAAGRPHLTAGYRNWRAQPTRHTEADFSDGTLRLIGLLWTLISAPASGGVLLLEEPELSLNTAVVRKLPGVLASAQRDKGTQVLLSTHAPEMLDDEGILAEEVLVLQVTGDGTTARLLSEIDDVAGELLVDLPKSPIVESLIAPKGLDNLVKVGTSRSR